MIKDVEIRSIFKNDFHVHTAYSVCAKLKSQATPLQMVKQSERLGMKTIGFTDHFAQFPPYPTQRWVDCGVEMIASLRNDIGKINTPIKILVAVEADVINKDKLSIDKEFAKKLDYVIISASHFHLPGIIKPKSTKTTSIAKHYVSMLNNALNFDFISIIAHPFKTPNNVLGSPTEYLSVLPKNDLYKIAIKAKQQRIAMEINAHLGIDQDYLQAIKKFIKICKEVGVKFTYGSDAHHKNDLSPTQGIINAIQELQLEPKDFLTEDELTRIHRESK